MADENKAITRCENCKFFDRGGLYTAPDCSMWECETRKDSWCLEFMLKDNQQPSEEDNNGN